MCAIPRVTPLRIFFFAPACLAPCLTASPIAALPFSKRIIGHYALPAASTKCRSPWKSPVKTRFKALRSALGVLRSALLPKLLHALLAGDGLARALAGAGVGARALAANREAAAM